MDESNGDFDDCDSNDAVVVVGCWDSGLVLEEAALAACSCKAASALVDAELLEGEDRWGYNAWIWAACSAAKAGSTSNWGISFEAVDVAPDVDDDPDDVWSLKWLINSSPLGNLFPQNSPVLIQLHIKGGWEESWLVLEASCGIPPKGGIVIGGNKYGFVLVEEPATAMRDAYWWDFIIVVGQLESLQRGSVQGLLAAISAIILILGLAEGDVNDAYADRALGGITDDIVTEGCVGCDIVEVIGGVVDTLMLEGGVAVDVFGVDLPCWGDCTLWNDGIDPIGDVDGLVDVVDPDDFKGGEQVFVEKEDEGGLYSEVLVLWILLASEYSLGDIALFFVVDLFEEWELMLELIIFDSILLQARVSIASGLTFESYCNSNIRNYFKLCFMVYTLVSQYYVWMDNIMVLRFNDIIVANEKLNSLWSCIL